MRILMTGGAGFIGSNLAYLWREQFPNDEIVCFDNLYRRGSELQLGEFRKRRIQFVHGDIRNVDDFATLTGNFDLMIDAAAEPSVIGNRNVPAKIVATNFGGTLNSLEYARFHVGRFIFLSTSRVYGIEALRQIPMEERESRLFSKITIDETFSTLGYRSLYGFSKLSSEGLITEYAHHYGLDAIINRLGVVSGAGQWGKGDQGFFSYWMVQCLKREREKASLTYKGFGGKGLQVRDILHPRDLFNLIKMEANYSASAERKLAPAEIFNAGGGIQNSVSLYEYHQLCEELTGNRVPVSSIPETDIDDIPYYVTNYSKVQNKFGWQPSVSVREIAIDLLAWINKLKQEWDDSFLPFN